MYSKAIEAYKQKLKLSGLQREVVVGLLLGDGHLETQNNGRTYRLKIEHSYLQKEYADWLCQIFKDWVLTPPQKKEQMVQGVKYEKYWFSTISHGAFRFYAGQFYSGKRKVLPKLIARWLTPRAIAVWFMDDGSIKSKRHRALILNTQSFTKAELNGMIKILQKKFGVNASLRKQRGLYQLLISGQSAQEFASIIKPHLIPSMNYKLGILGNTLPKK